MQPVSDKNRMSPGEQVQKENLSKIESSLGCKKMTDYLKVLPSALTPEICNILENLAPRNPQAAYIYGAVLSNEPDDPAKCLRGAELIVQADASKFTVPKVALGKAHYRLGNSLLGGTDYEKNKRGAQHMIKAAETKYTPAFHRAAKLYEKGNYEVPQDLGEAYKWIVIAAAREKDPGQQSIIDAEMKEFQREHGNDFVKEGMAKAKLQIDSWNRVKTVPVLPA